MLISPAPLRHVHLVTKPRVAQTHPVEGLLGRHQKLILEMISTLVLRPAYAVVLTTETRHLGPTIEAAAVAGPILHGGGLEVLAEAVIKRDIVPLVAAVGLP